MKLKKWFSQEEVLQVVPAFATLYEEYVKAHPKPKPVSPTAALKEKVAELEAKLAEARPGAPETH
jgi:hypothetical protein